MIKTVLKIDGMMCGMCESHMNDVVRKSCSPKKVNSSAKNGETVVISEAAARYSVSETADQGHRI